MIPVEPYLQMHWGVPHWARRRGAPVAWRLILLPPRVPGPDGLLAARVESSGTRRRRLRRGCAAVLAAPSRAAGSRASLPAVSLLAGRAPFGASPAAARRRERSLPG